MSRSEQEFLDAVRQSRHLGYGRMMQIVSREWYQSDPIGALTPSGPCYGQASAKWQEMEARAIAADPLFKSSVQPAEAPDAAR